MKKTLLTMMAFAAAAMAASAANAVIRPLLVCMVFSRLVWLVGAWSGADD